MRVPQNAHASMDKESLFAAFLTFVIVKLLLSVNPFTSINYKNLERRNVEVSWLVQELPQEDVTIQKKYAEANPLIPSHPPDETNLISSQDQQVAQPILPELIKDNQVLPSNTGNSQNFKIIPLSKSQESKKQLEQSEIKSTYPQTSMPSPTLQSTDLDMLSKTTTGWQIESKNSHKNQKNINLSDQAHEKDNKNPTSNKKQDTNRQKSRPKLSLEVLNGPLLQKALGTPRIGKVAIECRLNPYGVYMQSMLKAIERQWGELILNSYRYTQREQYMDKATFRFTLLRSGRIKNLNQVGHGRNELLSAELCRQAIASRAPFGEWTQKMIEEFGESDEVSITFNYR